MTFRDLLETSTSNSTAREDYDGTDLWKNSTAKLVKTEKDYQLHKDKDVYFLVKDDKYIAHIDGTHDKCKGKRALFINAAFAKERGSYRILFDMILKTSVKYIISDALLSSDAERFWKKILADTSLTKIILEFNEDILYNKSSFTKEETKEIFTNPDITIGVQK